jgi:hypothetical protein
LSAALDPSGPFFVQKKKQKNLYLLDFGATVASVVLATLSIWPSQVC